MRTERHLQVVVETPSIAAGKIDFVADIKTQADRSHERFHAAARIENGVRVA